MRNTPPATACETIVGRLPNLRENEIERHHRKKTEEKETKEQQQDNDDHYDTRSLVFTDLQPEIEDSRFEFGC